MSVLSNRSLPTLQNPDMPSNPTPSRSSLSQRRFTPRESDAMCPEMTTFRWHSLQTLMDDSGMCMQIMVPIPAFTSSGYILSLAAVPPFILTATAPQRDLAVPTTGRGGSLRRAASWYSGSSRSISTMSPTVRGEPLRMSSEMCSCTMLSAGMWTLNMGNPNLRAASGAALKLEPMTPFETSLSLSSASASETLTGTPYDAKRSVCHLMTSGKMFLDLPRGWCDATASILMPFSLSLSASRISSVPMSMPHTMFSASVSLAWSMPEQKRESE